MNAGRVSKDSKTRSIQTSGDISPVPTRKKAIFVSEVRFTLTITVRVIIRVRGLGLELGLRFGLGKI